MDFLKEFWEFLRFEKKDQNLSLKKDYTKEFELD